VHPYIVQEAAKVYSFAELESFLEQVKAGAKNEDVNDVVIDDPAGVRSEECVTIEHFWDADKGDDTQGLQVAVCSTPVLNAWQKASRLWQQVLNEYRKGNKKVAYERLGRVAHLLADMTVPAHAHMDPHPPQVDDDAYEEWITTNYGRWNADNAKREGGLISFPAEVTDCLYYLFYTANQTADYFASDDCDGDTNDRRGWMDYRGWPTRPTRDWHLDTARNIERPEDNADNDDGDNDNDGDLTRIANRCFVYAIRATATLYQVFYETVIKPEVKLTVTASKAEIGTLSKVTLDVMGCPRVLKEVMITRPSGAVDTLFSGEVLVGPGAAVTYTYTDANEVGIYKVEVFFDSASLTEKIERTPLRAPSGLRATGVRSSQIDLAWRDNSQSEKGFEIQRRRSGESFSTIAKVSANTTSYSDTGLSCGKYYYRVRAYNDAGYSDWSNEDYDTTPNCCGNGRCESGESCSSCPQDCGPCCRCGDGLCQSWSPCYESCSSCPSDCCPPPPCRYCGGDPPIWGKIMAFPTPERHMGQDLNGDGDKNDTVLRYMNIETGEVVNTGAIVSGTARAISIYEDVIAFVGERGMIRYYRISTGEIKDVEMIGSTPSLYGNILVFRSSEQIAIFDLMSATFLDINIQGSSPTIYGDLLAFEWGGTVRYHDLMSKKTVDTKELGSSPFIWGDIIAFVADERTRGQDLNADGDQHDAIISYYRISTGETVYTGVSGSLPWVYGNVIVFCAYEWAGGKDLNADGKTLGSVIQYYDISTGEVVNTGILGAEPSIYQETITYYVWESWVGCDLTGDGDVADPVVGFFRIGDGVWARKGADKE